jgi:hypothetical protein
MTDAEIIPVRGTRWSRQYTGAPTWDAGHTGTWLTHDAAKIREAEREGIDVRGDDFEFPTGH